MVYVSCLAPGTLSYLVVSSFNSLPLNSKMEQQPKLFPVSRLCPKYDIVYGSVRGGHGLPVCNPVSEDGVGTEDSPELSGLTVASW